VFRHEQRDLATLLVVTEKGRGKRTAIDDYRFQTRGGMGVINVRINEQTGKVVAIKGVLADDELMLMTRNGVVNRQRVSEIRVIGRATQGVRVLALDEGDVLVDVARVVPDDESENGEDADLPPTSPPPDTESRLGGIVDVGDATQTPGDEEMQSDE
jgi:DNA gyrase subunit A